MTAAAHSRQSYRNLFLPGVCGWLNRPEGVVGFIDQAKERGLLNTADQRFGMEDAIRDQRQRGPADDDEKLLEALAYLRLCQ